jgi:hypothetical protein
VSDKEMAPAVPDAPRGRTKKGVFMANTSVPTFPREATTRIERGRRLYAEHADQIWFDRRLRCWIVPSQHDGTSVYEVHLAAEEVCECKDFEYRSPEGGCVHIIAATLCKAKTFACCGCGDRFPNRELYEVPDGHLTFFEGDALCEECAGWHGVL